MGASKNNKKWHADSIYDIPVSFYKKNGISAVVMDLDNTLDPFYVKNASDKAIEYIQSLKESGIFVAIVSNNTPKRVQMYAEKIPLDAMLAGAKKPSEKKLKPFLEEHCIKPETVVLIGDQLFTDGGAAENAGTGFVLTERLTWFEMFWTYFNRFRELFVRRRWIKEGKFGPKIEKED